MFKKNWWVKREELGEGNDLGGGDGGDGGDAAFDMAGAVDEVGAGLGFETDPAPEPDPELTPDPAAAAAPAAPAPTDPAAPPAVPDPSAAAPRTWRPEAAAAWATLPPVVQQEIAKREEDIFKGIEGYKESAAFGNTMKSVLDPYMPILQQHGITPEGQVADMMQAHYTLAFGAPEQKAALIQQIAKDYGVPLDGLTTDQPYVDPQVQALQNDLKALQSKIAGNEAQVMESKKAEITAHVQKFAVDPANVYFEELADDIARLLRTGAEKTVESAYEAAMWLNPAVREKELSRQQAAKEATARQEAEAKVAAAKKARSANVRSTAQGGSAAAPLGSMDDTLQETLRNINARG